MAALGWVACLALAVAAQEAEGPKPIAKKLREQRKDEVIRFRGRLTGKSTDKVRGGHFANVHEATLTPGRSYVIEMTRTSSSGMDAYLRVENSKTERIRNESGGFVEDDDSGGNLNARLVFTPTVADKYRIIATTCNPGQTGDYTVTISPIPIGAAPPAPGMPTAVLTGVEFGDLFIVPHFPVGAVNPGNNVDQSHGYIEYRFTIENNSESTAHDVQLTLPRHRSGGNIMGIHLQAIRKLVQVPPQGVVEVSLFQPDMPVRNFGDIEVMIDGRVQDDGVPMQGTSARGRRINPFMHGFYSAPGPGGSIAQSSILVGPGGLQQALEQNVFKSAVGVHEAPLSGASSIQSGQYPVAGPYFNRRYSYSATNRFIPMPQAAGVAGWSKHWLGYSSFDALALPAQQLQAAPPEVQSAIFQYTEAGGTLLIVGACKLPEGWVRTRGASKYFSHYYPGFGECVVAETPVDQWDPDAWREVTGAWERGAKAWLQQRSTSQAHREFEVVANIGIPVRGLFIFMILFVVLIGPINFYWLTQTRRRIWLLWTVPVFSLITCAILFGYMLVSEGWRGHYRAAGVTVLDEATQRASTVGWLGYYTPTTPSGGLHFSDDTEFTPHLLQDRYLGRSSKPRTINWTNGQHLDTGWLDAKVPLYLMARRSEKRHQRIIARPQADGGITVVNALEAPVTRLYLAGPDGKIWKADNLAPGPEVKLQPTDLVAVGKDSALRNGFAKTWINLLDEMEKKPAEFLRPGCYLAIIDGESPFLEQGLQHVQSRRLQSVVYGILKEPL